jgi:hypothetical protein
MARAPMIPVKPIVAADFSIRLRGKAARTSWVVSEVTDRHNGFLQAACHISRGPVTFPDQRRNDSIGKRKLAKEIRTFGGSS